MNGTYTSEEPSDTTTPCLFAGVEGLPNRPLSDQDVIAIKEQPTWRRRSKKLPWQQFCNSELSLNGTGQTSNLLLQACLIANSCSNNGRTKTSRTYSQGSQDLFWWPSAEAPHKIDNSKKTGRPYDNVFFDALKRCKCQTWNETYFHKSKIHTVTAFWASSAVLNFQKLVWMRPM